MFRGITCLLILLFFVSCKENTKNTQKSLPSANRYIFQRERWNKAELNNKDIVRLDKEVARYNQYKNRYKTIEKMRSNGVPAIIISGLHYRESTGDFTKHLHEGSPLTGRTKYVPKGRPIKGSPPFTFEESSEDALYIIKSMDKVNWSSLEESLQNIEKFNGLGYQSKGRISPYLWAGSSIYTSGKYVADHVYSETAVDKQLGVAAILKRAEQRGQKLSFSEGRNMGFWDSIKAFLKQIGWF